MRVSAARERILPSARGRFEVREGAASVTVVGVKTWFVGALVVTCGACADSFSIDDVRRDAEVPDVAVSDDARADVEPIGRWRELAEAYCAGLARCPLHAEAGSLADHLDVAWCSARVERELQQAWPSLSDDASVDVCVATLRSRCPFEDERRGDRSSPLLPGCEPLYPEAPVALGGECVHEQQCEPGASCSDGVEFGCDDGTFRCVDRGGDCRSDLQCVPSEEPVRSVCSEFRCVLERVEARAEDEPCELDLRESPPRRDVCRDGLVCGLNERLWGPTHTCRRPASVGERCRLASCAAGLLCVEAVCVSPTLGTQEGDECSIEHGVETCDERLGLVCVEGTCRRVTGEVDGLCPTRAGSALGCGDDARCRDGVCAALRPLGATCEAGFQCLSGACDRERATCVASCARDR